MQTIKYQSLLAKKLAQKLNEPLSDLPLKIVKKDKGLTAPANFMDDLQTFLDKRK